MRIIGGEFKSRRFNPPDQIPTRPTTDIAKQGLFNIIDHSFHFDNVSFLDLFSGTGSLSYEFASRGCKDITSVEIFPRCVQFIRKTSRELGLSNHQIIQGDVFAFIQQRLRTYDLIFAGPPYPLPNLATLPDCIFEAAIVEGDGWFILEHNPEHDFKNHPHYWKEKNYGSTIFSFFVNNPLHYLNENP